jgi:serine/threonine protein kinase
MTEPAGDSGSADRGQRQVPPGYELIQQIGRGATAVVSRARETKSGADVALKIWTAPLDAGGRERFDREVAILRQLDGNPNIVRLHAADAGDDVTPGWMATELFEESLADRLGRGPVERDEAYRIADGLLAGLEAIHGLGHLHRDVKPANVLIGSGRVVLCDLGIITTVVSETEHAAAGTVIAPELRLPDQQPTIRSDIFSAADTLLLLFGRDMPDALGDVLVRASSSRPSDRPPDTATFRRQLAATSPNFSDTTSAAASPDPADQGEPDHQEPDSPPSRWFTRPASVAVSGLSAVLIVGALAYGVWDRTRDPSDRAGTIAESSTGGPNSAGSTTPGATVAASPPATPPNPSPTPSHSSTGRASLPAETASRPRTAPAGTLSGRQPAPTNTAPKAGTWTHPVTLTVAPGKEVSVSAVVNEAPAEGRSYWLVIELFYPDTDPQYVEYYARWHLPSGIGKAGPKTITFGGGADMTYRRTAQVVSASAAVARQFQKQLDSPQADTDPLPELPCSDCTVSKVVTVTPR